MSNGIRILIVEDEVIIRTALRKLLTRNKHDVKEAGSVSEATGKHNAQERQEGHLYHWQEPDPDHG